ncbi:two component transcriptional regulator, LuxR family [Chitinophaga sp. YR627]|uniref:response regulator transcription factor n=1 Tax=Chitinophaga sp. YR627 TaxID=1881041 RepID=UPI0008EC7D9E|nr:response regulator transcription factor [Chitinophaga sp. YR627]SFM76215.1 two component transcriptional regulator, LuxR family [Chitinophaga sp. YR627]
MNTPYPAASALQEAPHSRILLVTGDAAILRKFRQLLLPTYDVVATNTVAEAIDIANRQLPDLILCDVLVADTSGYQFLISLRDDPSMKHLPFILFNRLHVVSNIRKGMNLGADDFLVFPFTGEELIKSIQSRLNRYQHIRETMQPRETLIRQLHVEGKNPINERLSKTEAKILDMIARGMSSRDIASYKCISVRTVDNHRHNITKKLQLSGPNALVKFAIGYGGVLSRQ